MNKKVPTKKVASPAVKKKAEAIQQKVTSPVKNSANAHVTPSGVKKSRK